MLAKGLLLILLLAELFYDSLWAVPALSLLLPYIIKRAGENKRDLARQQLNIAFRDGILAVSGALSAGYAVETAFGEALKSLYFLYPGNHRIIKEFQLIVRGIEMNRTPEELLDDFAERSGLEDVQIFAEVFAVSKRSGGNIAGVISDTAARIGEKIEVRREIETYLSAKKFEQKIMNVMPAGIILYVKLTSPDFLQGLYKNPAGILIMTCCLLLYGGAYLLSEKLMKIEV